MKMTLASAVGLVACGCSVLALGSAASGAWGTASMSSLDEYAVLATEEESEGLRRCVAICYSKDPPEVIAGSCFPNEFCCGWVNCNNPTQKSIACCFSDQICHSGIHTLPLPPVQAWCQNEWNP